MGVNHLWSILEPVKRKENLSALSSKTLCVDLSGWVCEAQCAKGLKQNVKKPHLRNLFFRLLHLTRLGVKLVFVVDGKPPELKWNAIAKRVQARNGGQSTWRGKNPAIKAGSGARVGRSHFAVWVREVMSFCFMFDLHRNFMLRFISCEKSMRTAECHHSMEKVSGWVSARRGNASARTRTVHLKFP